MTIRIKGDGVKNFNYASSITPLAMADMGQYGSPSVWRGFNVSSTTYVADHRTTINLLNSMGSPNYVVYAQSIRQGSDGNRDLITCIDGQSSATTATSFSIRTETEASNNRRWTECQFAIWY